MNPALWIDRVARFRKGRTALMRVDKVDDLCGYPAAYGVDIGGGYIHTAVANLRPLTAEDRGVWDSYWEERRTYAD